MSASRTSQIVGAPIERRKVKDATGPSSSAPPVATSMAMIATGRPQPSPATKSGIGAR